ncbi:uncharacterized mitochondrial protein AtMg00860-like [Rutidosis leptorrhynchoides]|uniref:uncharacterized mitochondrial protein AtMg00860-like n=1 Tax=Rutidosis leptorrhynchoides TaxID=125765 RepID=UPI003A9995D5
MSPCAVPAIFVPKHDGLFQMCMDSRAVNKITIKYQFPIPRFDDLLDQLNGAMKLYANGKKCHFLAQEVGYIISGNGIRMKESKIETITNWPIPSTIHEIRSLHGLASFYHRFIKNFSTVIALVTECMKGGRFKWTEEATTAFNTLKDKVTHAPILALPNLNEVFQVEYDASGVGIGGVLSQNKRPVVYFSENLMK